MQNWLTDEEQYQEALNNEQILRIKDPILREIRMSHWKYQTKLFFDEKNITDEMLNQLVKEDILKEKREIEQYKQKKVKTSGDGI